MFTWIRNIPAVALIFVLLIFNSYNVFASELQWTPNGEEDLAGYMFTIGTK